MSQHSQTTQQGPSTGQVVIGAASIALSAAASVYLVSGPGLDPRKAVAVILGGVLTGLLTVHVMGMVADRAVIADRAARAAERERVVTEYEREIVAREHDLDTRERALALEREESRRTEPGPTPEQVQAVDADLTRYLNEELDPAGYPREEPPRVDQGPVVYPEPSLDQTRSWVTGAAGWRPPEPPLEPQGPGYADRQEPLEYRADPARPWNAFEPSPPRRAALGSVAMPLPPRDTYVDPGPYSTYVPVSPGRQIDCDGSCGDPGCPAYADRLDRPTEVMGPVREYDAAPGEAVTEVIGRVR
jgi:hypothetical protein